MLANLGLVFFPAFDWAISKTHPEREERLLYTRDQIIEEGLLDMPQIKELKPSIANIKDVERVHIGVPNIRELIKDAHLVSAGGAIRAAEAVMNKEVHKAFALVRPPGHHAMRVVHGTRGFCTINIEAIMVEYLRKNYNVRKIAIIDTDVHHGDGTQDIFYHDPNTLFISFHQDGRTLYPGSGFVGEMGSPKALGTTVNLPLPPRSGDKSILKLIDELVLPILDDFKPDIIINSAGQDNHYSDPLADMAVTARGYGDITKKLNAQIAVLEGGYAIESALPYVNTGIILAMAGLNYDKVIEPDLSTYRGESKESIVVTNQLINEWRQIWPNRLELQKRAMDEAGDFWRRKRNIYYDDSQINEKQTETIRMCNNCTGSMSIESESRNYKGLKSAFVVKIPYDACPKCRQHARDEIYKAQKTKKHQHYIIQDNYNDTYEEI